MPKLPSPSSEPMTRSVQTSKAGSPLTVRSRSLAETVRLGEAVGRLAQGGEVFALYGELGTGKTAFVRGLATGLGAGPRSVSSPTFVLIHEYAGRLRLAHADLYRLESPSTLLDIGLEDYFDGHTVVAVEWAERALNELPLDRLDVRFSHQSRTERNIILSATGPRARALLGRYEKRPLRTHRSRHV